MFLQFNLEISGKKDNDIQLENILLIEITLSIFHLDKPGKNDIDFQKANINLISITLLTLLTFQIDISGKDNNDEQLAKH